MTINLANNNPRIEYTVAQGVVQTVFTVPFEYFEDADVSIYVDGVKKSLGADYTLSGGDGSTGVLTFVAGSPQQVTGGVGGSEVSIVRDVALERTTDFASSGYINRVALNTQLDTIVAQVADLDDRVSRSLHLNDSVVGPDMLLTDARKGKIISFNETTGAVETNQTIADFEIAVTAITVATAQAVISTNEAAASAASAAAALVSETNAGTSETNSASSATAAAASAVDATNNGAAQVALATAQAALATTNGAAQVNLAADQVTLATTAKTAAELAETNAETAESNAATSATNAATSATTASTGASTASTKASEAATSATNSATSATESETAKTAAEAAKDAALAALDSFDDRYLGSKASDPTLDNDGNALVAGALYYNTTDDVMKVYTGSVWVAAYASLSGALLTTNNLSDVVNVSSSRTNLGLGTTDSPTFANVTAGNVILDNTNPNITSSDADGFLVVTGGTSGALGANMRLHGPTHASFANDILFRTTTTAQLRYDDSASTWDFSANDITTTGTVTAGSLAVDNTTGSPDQALMTLQADMGVSDRNMQIKSPATDSTSAPFRFTTGNSFAFEIDANQSALVIDDSANVGIGDASPSEALSVTGNIAATGTVVSQDEVRAEVVAFGSNQDAPYMTAATTSYTGASTNWGTYGFQHRLKSNSGGEARITTDTSAGEVYSMSEAGNAIFAGTVTTTGTVTASGITLDNTFPFIKSNDADGFLFLSGGTSGALGGNVRLYGPTHATNANDILFRSSSTGQLRYDSSEAEWNFQGNDIVTSGGIYLGGTAEANKLDDYEEGTWTPTVVSGTIVTSSACTYTKIGRLVHLTGANLQFSDYTSTATLQIENLPFTSSTGSMTGSAMAQHRDNNIGLTPFISNSLAAVKFYYSSSTVAFSPARHNTFNNASGNIYFSIVYLTDA